MRGRQEFELSAELRAPAQRVWEVISDHAGWQAWAGVQEVVLRQRGDPPPNGLGAIRVMRLGGLAIEEEVVEFDPGRRLVYRVCAGLPVRDCEIALGLEPREGATQLSWRVSFRPLVPGTGGLLRRLIEPRLEAALDGLARAL